jgi:hypothetical protein
MSTADCLYDPKATEPFFSPSPTLETANPDLSPVSEALSAPSPSPPPRSRVEITRRLHRDTEVLLHSLTNNPELHLPPGISNSGSAMTDRAEGTDPVEPPIGAGDAGSASTLPAGENALSASDLKATATAAVKAHEASSQSRERPVSNDPDSRHDSAQDKVPQLSPAKRQEITGRHSPALRLQTTPQALPTRELHPETITTSPTLSKHIIPSYDGAAGTLPAFHASSPTRDGSALSPQGEKLPSLQQVVGGQFGPLGELAEVATQQRDPRMPSHHQSPSFGSGTAQSPRIPHPHYGAAAPSPYYVPNSARSPTSTVSDQFYASPMQYPGTAYYADRRTSNLPEGHPHHPPSLPSASSSADSHAPTSSSMDGYSTAQTTPGEMPDGTPRPILPPPPGMPQSAVMVTGGFKCDHPECTAPPFQTQYLLRYVYRASFEGNRC